MDDTAPPISSEVNDLLLEISWADYNSFSDDKRDLEFKASIIFAGVGVLLGMITGSFDKINSIFALFSSIFLVFSGLLCVFVLLIRKYQTIDSENTYNYLKLKNSLEDIQNAKKLVWNSLDSYTKNNRAIYVDMAIYLRWSIPLFFIGILLLFWAVFGNMITSSIYCYFF